MELIELVRVSDNNEYTLGVLNINGHPFCNTLELPYRQNQKSISCINAGLYRVSKILDDSYATRFGSKELFWVKDVPGRSDILFHPGNQVKDTYGCILPGMWAGTQGWIHSSRKWMEDLLIMYDEFDLRVRNLY